MRNQKRSARKGFTLVEVIVVLVILALLAAIAIPAMTGWIDKAREKRLVVACRTCVNAAQTLVAETYGATGQATAPGEGDVTQLAGVPGSVSGITLADAAIATLTYTDQASSDFVTYTLSPGPRYEFGTGLTVAQMAAGVATALQGQTISYMVRSVGPNAEASGEYTKNYNNTIAALKNVPGLWTSMNSGNTVWEIRSENNKKLLLVYEGSQDKLGQLAEDTRIPLTVYDLNKPGDVGTKKTGYVGSATTANGKFKAFKSYYY